MADVQNWIECEPYNFIDIDICCLSECIFFYPNIRARWLIIWNVVLEACNTTVWAFFCVLCASHYKMLFYSRRIDWPSYELWSQANIWAWNFWDVALSSKTANTLTSLSLCVCVSITTFDTMITKRTALIFTRPKNTQSYRCVARITH